MAKDEHFGTQIGWGGIGLWYNALIPLDSPFRSTGGSRAYSMTSSARSMIDGGTARPSALAALRFTTISNFVGN